MVETNIPAFTPDSSGPERHQPKMRHRFNRNKRIVIAILVIAIMSVAAAVVIPRKAAPIPSEIVRRVTFPLYYPAALPKGYELARDSFSSTSQVVTYYVRYEGTKKLIFSLQPKPADFDFEGFYLKQLFGAKEILTPIGKATIGTMGETTIASVVSDRTWILIQAPDGIQTAELEAIAKSLTEAQP